MVEVVVGIVVALAAFGVGMRFGRRAEGAGGPRPAAALAPQPSLRDGHRPLSEADLPDAATVRSAMTGGEFAYHVQPIWNVETGRMIGVEALSRWLRADGSIGLPETFLTQITRSYADGGTPPMDRAGATARPFTDAGLFCAFNLSSQFLDRSATDAAWMDDLLGALAPDRIVFEITEGATISHPDRTARLIDALRERGVRFALDDFGTGLSNLERLQTYPVDFVKLDRRFVQGIGAGRDVGILKALVGLSEDLSFDVIAEGIEAEDERDRIRAAGIVLQQGYLHGRPGPVDDWAARIGERLEA
ncbi:EAL domain-containing protein [Jannaschia sp. Os4]|uniref:EAL domain-containing protein n=1 Tax=Jannaschia sp. Os4 TaxID=2807617 RepID=UPI00193A802F|nr:EAL domain-containing protein [Jannaschia sp. Os4]MBM2574985.1 EAL domain-containing protein [Jannaschia sp. Os4]